MGIYTQTVTGLTGYTNEYTMIHIKGSFHKIIGKLLDGVESTVLQYLSV